VTAAAAPGAVTHRIAPDQETTGWPPGVRYIIGNEGCERFSYYGMRSILTLYMATVLYAEHPAFKDAPKAHATAHYHLFVAAVYAVPMIGAIIADRLLGKYRTILSLSLVYCAGHAVLALAENTVEGLWLGLGLIAIGSGGIKPCVSAHVGDQFGKNNWFRVRTVYQAFYFIINFGSFFSTLLIPWVWKKYGIGWAFGIPGILMGFATLFFWMGRKVFVHVPPRPGGMVGLLDTLSAVALFGTVGHLFFTGALAWPVKLAISAGFLGAGLALFVLRQKRVPDDGFLAVTLWSLMNRLGAAWKLPAPPAPPASANAAIATRREALAGSPLFGPAVRAFGVEAAEGPPAVFSLISVFLLVSLFWALFDQHGSSWVLQAQQMNLVLFGRPVEASQISALNPAMVMALIPLLNFALYPAWDKLSFKPTPLRRMTLGMVFASLSFVAVALVQRSIDRAAPGSVNIAWQFIPYLIITVAEVLVSVTGLEFAYTQAPRRMKSTIMGFWLLSVSLGNVLVALVAKIKLPPEPFFWLFAGLMLAAALLFGLRAAFYTYQDYVQE
jgi:proton-dependent oligopeptide transporter, POT family